MPETPQPADASLSVSALRQVGREIFDELDAVEAELNEWIEYFGVSSPHDTNVMRGDLLGKEQARANKAESERDAAIAERDVLLIALKELRDAVKKVPEMNKQTYDALGIFVNRVIANAEKDQSNGTK